MNLLKYNKSMRVYRFLSEEELILILNGNSSKLGRYFDSGLSNTHKYDVNEKYLHFFFRKNDCEYIKTIHQNHFSSDSGFLAEFNIPLARIIGHIGKGFYESNKGGYDKDHDTCYELALPSSIFNPSWIKGYEKIYFERNMDYSKPLFE